MSFALPGCRSNFSLLWGTVFPEQLAAKAAEAGIEHLGLADDDNLYGAIDFYRACRDAGINPLIGTRLTTLMGDLHLIASNYEGYQNLCRLITQRQLEGAVSEDDLRKYFHHLFCLAPMGKPLKRLKDIFGRNLYLSLDGTESRSARDIVDKLNILPIANSTVSFMERKDYNLHRLMRAIDSGSLIGDLGDVPSDSSSAYFPDRKEMRRRYALFPEAVANGIIMAEKCHVVFPEHKNLLPAFTAYDGDNREHLRAKCLEGLRSQKGQAAGVYQARLNFELEVIARTGFTDYFLIVSGIIDHCRRTDIPVVGRGSAAGSLAAFSLGITQVDPIREGLYFERFLNEARSDPPDIDLDIDWRRRDDVLEHIYDRYGRDRTAMIATYTRFRARMAVREVAKAVGLPPDEINRFAKRLPYTNPSEITKAVKRMPRVTREGIDIDRYGSVLDAAARLDNFPRHLGIHPGGIVITPRPLTDYVPLERATKGLVVTQCDMYQAEKLGLIKIDVLGQRGLGVIVDCHRHVRKIKGDDFVVPDNDEKTYQLLQSGKTIGVFQIESPGLRALLRDLKPGELNDITLALALIRPGASDSGMKKVFLDRHHGEAETAYPHPRLEKILKETFGVFIYQEQVLLCAREIAGFNLPAADLLRRAITKARKETDYKNLRRRFTTGALKNGIPSETINKVFKLLRNFAGFGFCKAHAATYGYLAYQSAYFKTHYPARFMKAVLDNGGGYYPASVYIAEARRLGTTIASPDINDSEAKESLREDRLYVGLNRVRDLEQETIDQIIEKRPFVSFDDFLARVRLSAGETENLIKVGAFDSLQKNRPHLLWRLHLARVNGGSKATRESEASPRRSTPGDLFAGQLIIPTGKRLPPLPDLTSFEKFRYEKDILGFSATRHPLTMFPAYRIEPLAGMISRENHGRRIDLAAWRVNIKQIKTREKKEWMVFLTLEDLEDTFEVVLFPEIYKKYAELIRRYRFLQVSGEVNIDGDNVAVVASTLSPAPTGLSEQPYL
ncbi:MAG: DNA polymerase III subunit alpha [FCB group bacterium]|nr:DNA polymerase III subunit alpha [FCB group bacterium]